jgi:hypothetical protein
MPWRHDAMQAIVFIGNENAPAEAWGASGTMLLGGGRRVSAGHMELSSEARARERVRLHSTRRGARIATANGRPRPSYRRPFRASARCSIS